MMTFEGVGRDEMARILIDAGLAVTLSRAYCCARKEIARRPGTTGPPVDVKDAFVNLRWFVKLRERFENMDPMLDENEDLAELCRTSNLMGMRRVICLTGDECTGEGGGERMDPMLDGNEHLAEIVRNIQLDGNEESSIWTHRY